MKNKIENNSVSRGTMADLKAYEASLHEWQQKFNLVSNASLQHSWQRHFEDSMQLFPLLPKDAKVLYDLGSGAGFPGLVLAVMAKENTPYLKGKLVESTKKKTLYLKHVAELTHTPVEIFNDRIENLKPEKADVITSRALASLKDLLGYSEKFWGRNTRALFLKGKKHLEEIMEAKKQWSFDVEITQSQTDPEGKILIITNLKRSK